MEAYTASTQPPEIARPTQTTPKFREVSAVTACMLFMWIALECYGLAHSRD